MHDASKQEKGQHDLNYLILNFDNSPPFPIAHSAYKALHCHI